MSNNGFDISDPYPSCSISYKEAQRHAAQVDLWLGLNTQEVEAHLLLKQTAGTEKRADEQHWIGLPIQTLLTPYIELRNMLSIVQPLPETRVVDLGAGYGRMGFVLAKHYPQVDFIGYEIIEERVIEGKRCLEKHSCLRAQLICENLSRIKPCAADIYFIYDFGSRLAVLKTLEDLKEIARTRPITVIGRGRLSRDLIELETLWLSQINRPEHHGNFSIYRS